MNASSFYQTNRLVTVGYGCLLISLFSLSGCGAGNGWSDSSSTQPVTQNNNVPSTPTSQGSTPQSTPTSQSNTPPSTPTSQGSTPPTTPISQSNTAPTTPTSQGNTTPTPPASQGSTTPTTPTSQGSTAPTPQVCTAPQVLNTSLNSCVNPPPMTSNTPNVTGVAGTPVSISLQGLWSTVSSISWTFSPTLPPVTTTGGSIGTLNQTFTQNGVYTITATALNVNGLTVGTPATTTVTINCPTGTTYHTDVQSCTPPMSITNVTTPSTWVGQATNYHVVGVNIPSTALLISNLSTCGAPTNLTSTGFSQTCTANTAGTAAITVFRAASVTTEQYSTTQAIAAIATCKTPLVLNSSTNSCVAPMGVNAPATTTVGSSITIALQNAWTNVVNVIWSFGQGIATVTTSVVNAIQQTFTSAGTYTITATTQDASGNTVNTASTQLVVTPNTYTAQWTLAATTAAVGTSTLATVTLNNSGAVAASNAAFTLNLPVGFNASNLTQGCGGTLTTVANSNTLTMTNASVPAGGSCTFGFTLNVPILALAVNYVPTFSISGVTSPTNSTLVGQTLPNLSLTTNTPTPTPTALGVTPGLYAYNSFPTSAVSELDFYDTVTVDPGPNSEVFWSNYLYPLSGYTGMQTGVGAGKNGGRLFLFSVWGAADATAGSPGSTCTVSGTVADGAAGASCRFYYAWQLNHTYRFRITALGNYWFKSNVTDVTPGVVNPDSFDIGSIQENSTTHPTLANSIPHSSNDANSFLEYFSWNDHRTTCLTVPYSNTTVGMSTVDAATGKASTVTSGKPGSITMTGDCQTREPFINGVASQIAGIGQTSQGLWKTTNALCITAQNGLTDGKIPGSNNAVLTACPTEASVNQNGGGSAASSLMVYAQDKSIQLASNYCVTAKDPTATGGSNVTVESCIPGAVNQQWNVTGTAPNSNLVSVLSGQCMNPTNNILNSKNNPMVNLVQCSNATAQWTIPGLSFTY